MWTRLFDQHVDEATFQFEDRLRDLESLELGLDHLAYADARLAAHLDALLIGGDEAWPLLAGGFGSDEPGMAFVATFAALAGDGSRIDELRDALAAGPASIAGVAWAFGLAPGPRVSPLLSELAASTKPELRAISIAAANLRGAPPEADLAEALLEEDAALREAALEAAGRLRRKGNAASVRHLATLDDAELPSAWPALLLVDAGGAVALAREHLREGRPSAGAARILGLAGSPADVPHLARLTVREDDAASRAAILALGNLGMPECVSPLLGLLGGDERPARRAGAALTRILGAGVVVPADPVAAADDDEEDEDADWSGDDGLPLPSAGATRSAWEGRRSAFPSGRRYRAGVPLTSPGVSDQSPLGWRHDEALEGALANPGGPLGSTRAFAARVPVGSGFLGPVSAR